MGDTIPVVDDQPAPRRALATELGDAGFTVIEASDGREAWQRVCEDRPALVITDMVMPHSDGLYEAVGVIRGLLALREGLAGSGALRARRIW